MDGLDRCGSIKYWKGYIIDFWIKLNVFLRRYQRGDTKSHRGPDLRRTDEAARALWPQHVMRQEMPIRCSPAATVIRSCGDAHHQSPVAQPSSLLSLIHHSPPPQQCEKNKPVASWGARSRLHRSWER